MLLLTEDVDNLDVYLKEYLKFFNNGRRGNLYAKLRGYLYYPS
jgi:hypothetical protein